MFFTVRLLFPPLLPEAQREYVETVCSGRMESCGYGRMDQNVIYVLEMGGPMRCPAGRRMGPLRLIAFGSVSYFGLVY